MSNTDAHQLEQLLALLELESRHPVSLDSLDEAAYVEPDEPLPAAYATTVENMRALAYKAGDFTQSGLFDFQVGLHFMNRGRYQAAGQAFGWARRQWTFVGDRNLDLLAGYAEALASHRAQRRDEATAAYMDVRWALEREAGRDQTENVPRETAFLQALEVQLKETAGGLNAEIRRAETELIPGEPEVLPPVIRETPAPGAAGSAAGQQVKLVYRLGRMAVVDDWRRTIMPDLEALERVNLVLGLQWASEAGPPLRIEAIALHPAVELTLEGLLPETMAFLRDLAADQGFADRQAEGLATLEALQARLELRQRERQAALRQAREDARLAEPEMELSRLDDDIWRTARDIRQQEIANLSLLLSEVSGLLETLGPAAVTAEERFAAAAALAPDLQALADLLSGRGVGVLESVSD